MPFGPVPAQLDLVALEQATLRRWRDSDLVARVARHRAGGPRWVFYEGPPTANARPGLHHVWPRAFKDLWMRFATLRGYDVPRKGGWDCHGLPVEIEVEKELGLASKADVEAYGLEEFNARCRESVSRYVGDFVELTERSGVWIDTADAYWTLSNDYIASVWWLVRQLHDRGLLYEGHRVVPYCPRCGTALSSHELGQPGVYRDRTDDSAWVRFPLDPGSTGGVDADLVVWTTTPWTLVSNVAVAVGEAIDYVLVADPHGGRDLLTAAERAPEGATVRARWKGRDLLGWRYRRPFEDLALPEGTTRVVAGDFVSTEEGSGIVHLAPAFGAEDAEVARAEGLPVLNPLRPDGTFDDRVGAWAGRAVKSADPDIVADLDRRGRLLRHEPYTHPYPHCWRCGTPLLYWAKQSWFVRTSEHVEELLAQNEAIAWHPEHIKHGRFGDWLEHNIDWALSRDRFWGTPLPIWRCPEGHDTCVGSVAELSHLAGRDLGELDLHRPYVDAVTLRCPADGCGAPARRLTPVLDAWFDSGAMPSAQHHYPFAPGGPGTGQPPHDFPAEFICEAIDQTRGWFYSLLAVNTLVFGSTPYRHVVCLALVVDEHGAKMSKSKGNVMDPWEAFDRVGADALRWYFFSAGSPWSSRRVYDDGIREAAGRTLVTLWNVLSFFATYADLDGWEAPGVGARPAPGHVLDRWLLARLDEAVTAATAGLAAYDALAAATAVADLVDELSNWYLRRSRSRFWAPGGTGDPEAYATLHHCLVTTAILLAPFCPFLADELYRRLTGAESVHLAHWPSPGAGDEALLAEVAGARRLVGLGRAARTEVGLKLRQPLRRAVLVHPGGALSPAVRAEIADELNVKELADAEGLAGLMTWVVVPNFRALGPRLGPGVNEVKAALAAADGSRLRDDLATRGYLEVAGVRLGPDDVEVRAAGHPDHAVAQDGDWAVALATDVDDDLAAEGLARELVRELNDLRRRRGLAVGDRIEVRLGAPPALRAVLEPHAGRVATDVLAVALDLADPAPPGPADGAQTLRVGDHEVTVELSVAS